METLNGLTKLTQVGNKLKGGFAVLEKLQLEKLKGGTNYCVNKNCGSSCTNNDRC